jgi:hypothetical protein
MITVNVTVGRRDGAGRFGSVGSLDGRRSGGVGFVCFKLGLDDQTAILPNKITLRAMRFTMNTCGWGVD